MNLLFELSNRHLPFSQQLELINMAFRGISPTPLRSLLQIKVTVQRLQSSPLFNNSFI